MHKNVTKIKIVERKKNEKKEIFCIRDGDSYVRVPRNFWMETLQIWQITMKQMVLYFLYSFKRFKRMKWEGGRMNWRKDTKWTKSVLNNKIFVFVEERDDFIQYYINYYDRAN